MATVTFDGVGIGRACELRARQGLCAHHFIAAQHAASALSGIAVDAEGSSIVP